MAKSMETGATQTFQRGVAEVTYQAPMGQVYTVFVDTDLEGAVHNWRARLFSTATRFTPERTPAVSTSLCDAALDCKHPFIWWSSEHGIHKFPLSRQF
ncbi:hypothetical protein ColTof4_11912 [Colletotrichum tofieldiae]|nr:hypothetical protein ColTof3_03015 [Colletotrichum tofieldiae]GKT79489.1 hypothetical protein ColTof4_11912 [Colletotrichum tofieldiae]GKT82670.1 hypothetical protein Ct61P_00520 [Colletotrichum tofieldiae]